MTVIFIQFLTWPLIKNLYLFNEGNVLFNDALNTFYFTVIWCLFNDALTTFLAMVTSKASDTFVFKQNRCSVIRIDLRPTTIYVR